MKPTPAASSSSPLVEQCGIVAKLDVLQAEVDALKRPQAETAAALDAFLPAILDRAFKGELSIRFKTPKINRMIAKLKSAAARSPAPAYQLKIVLLGTEPSIWRTLQVPGQANLGWLHAVLQTAMGWTNSHLHHFLTADARYLDPRGNEDFGFGGEPDRDEAKATLLQIAPKVGAQFGYEYDFGDSWQHEITVEKLLPATGGATALCLDGAGACPPEDCGGIWGYAELLKALKNPKHPEHKSMKEWIGGAFDAKAFDNAKVNFWLGKLKWPRVTETQLRKVLMGRDNYAER